MLLHTSRHTCHTILLRCLSSIRLHFFRAHWLEWLSNQKTNHVIIIYNRMAFDLAITECCRRPWRLTYALLMSICSMENVVYKSYLHTSTTCILCRRIQKRTKKQHIISCILLSSHVSCFIFFMFVLFVLCLMLFVVRPVNILYETNANMRANMYDINKSGILAVMYVQCSYMLHVSPWRLTPAAFGSVSMWWRSSHRPQNGFTDAKRWK